jgi:hypothetical protein
MLWGYASDCIKPTLRGLPIWSFQNIGSHYSCTDVFGTDIKIALGQRCQRLGQISGSRSSQTTSNAIVWRLKRFNEMGGGLILFGNAKLVALIN